MINQSPSILQFGRLDIYVDGRWMKSTAHEFRPVFDPGSGRVIAEVPYSPEEEVDRAVQAASRAFEKWSKTNFNERIKYLFAMKKAFEDHLEELAAVNTLNHGKTLDESKGDLNRTLENINVAISVAYTLAKGEVMHEIAPRIDESMVREPLGVFGIISPFNFPIMIPFWFIPYAIVLGNTVVVKPSDITPLPMTKVMEILDKEVKLPPGVVNLVHGGRETAEALVKHIDVKGVAFVGSSPAAQNIYKLAGEHGKRCIAQGGAKNFIVVMPDANLDVTLPATISSFFGNCGQRCLAGSNLLLVNSTFKQDFMRKFVNTAAAIRVGHGLDRGTEMGPLVTRQSLNRVVSYIDKGLEQGARLVLDGRGIKVMQYPDGFYLGPSVFDDVTPDTAIAREEIFGPVASILSASTLDEAIEIINKSTSYGNMACIFTSNGTYANIFAKEVNAGNIGINVGVAAPTAYFPFAGRKNSFYGVLHGQIDSVDFFTDKKVIISRW
ncbi:MAG: CoA-acylating methylmalonate-semialdehyde dehydrogenase [Candidatus Caldarchaeum sp.]|uniref:methylmalonate-semialdehyde dehydrogenase (CoA acylating) n=1 Tax=Caldiarchaeum subterraneum TaxID=311458 RepID=A0A7C5LBV3_CALS0